MCINQSRYFIIQSMKIDKPCSVIFAHKHVIITHEPYSFPYQQYHETSHTLFIKTKKIFSN